MLIDIFYYKQHVIAYRQIFARPQGSEPGQSGREKGKLAFPKVSDVHVYSFLSRLEHPFTLTGKTIMNSKRQTNTVVKTVQEIVKMRPAALVATVAVLALGIAGYSLYIIDKAVL